MRRLNFLALSLLPVCAFCLCTVSCFGTGKQQAEKKAQTGASFFNSGGAGYQPYTGELVIIGASPKYSKIDNSIQTALLDAARKLSFFYDVSGFIVRQENIGNSVFDYNVKIDYKLIYDTDLDKYLEQLEYDPLTDVFESNNAVFVAARVNAGFSIPAFRGHSSVKERPKWIESPPGIEGYVTGVGYSTRLSLHSDTVIKSYEKAIIGIIENTITLLNSKTDDYSNSYSVFGFSRISSSQSLASCTLRNFLVIESWTDPQDLSVWTFAAAKPY